MEVVCILSSCVCVSPHSRSRYCIMLHGGLDDEIPTLAGPNQPQISPASQDHQMVKNKSGYKGGGGRSDDDDADDAVVVVVVVVVDDDDDGDDDDDDEEDDDDDD